MLKLSTCNPEVVITTEVCAGAGTWKHISPCFHVCLKVFVIKNKTINPEAAQEAAVSTEGLVQNIMGGMSIPGSQVKQD